MDKFTEARQNLGRALYKLLKQHGDQVNTTLVINNRWKFYSKHYGVDASYTVEYGWLFADNGDGLMAIRKNFRGPEDAVSQRTKLEDIETVTAYMPLVEKFLEMEAERNKALEAGDDEEE